MKVKIIRHSLLNFVGYALPILLGILSIPWLLAQMSSEQFGLLALAWTFISYMSLFDFGIGRAMSQQIAEQITKNNTKSIAHLFWNAHIVITGFATLGAVFMVITIFTATPYLPILDNTSQEEIPFAYYFLALTILPTLIINGLNNFLLSLEKFFIINIFRIIINSISFIIPIFVTAYPNHLPLKMSAIENILLLQFLIRCLITISLFMMCVKAYPHIINLRNFRFKWPRNLLNLGGWFTVTNIIGPIMVYFDRFLITFIISPQALTTYIIAFEVSSKLNIIPTAISNSLAPLFAKTDFNEKYTLSTIHTTIIVLSCIFLPILWLSQLYAEPAMKYWLKIDDASDMTLILKWLILGFYTNAIALIAYTYIQYTGRPDLTAKAHIIELPIYIISLWLCLHHLGIIGAAIAWTIRSSIDMLLLLAMTYHLNRRITIKHKIPA